MQEAFANAPCAANLRVLSLDGLNPDAQLADGLISLSRTLPVLEDLNLDATCAIGLNEQLGVIDYVDMVPSSVQNLRLVHWLRYRGALERRFEQATIGKMFYQAMMQFASAIMSGMYPSLKRVEIISGISPLNRTEVHDVFRSIRPEVMFKDIFDCRPWLERNDCFNYHSDDEDEYGPFGWG